MSDEYLAHRKPLPQFINMNERIHVGACQCLRKAGQPVNVHVCQRQLPGIVTISGLDSSGILVHDLLHGLLYGKHIIRLRRGIGQPAFVVKKYLLCLGTNDRILRRMYVFHIIKDRLRCDSAFCQSSRNKFLRSTAGHIPRCIQIQECRAPPCVHPISTACVSAHNIRFRPLNLHVLLRGESSTLNPLQSLARRHVQIGLQELLILLRSDPLRGRHDLDQVLGLSKGFRYVHIPEEKVSSSCKAYHLAHALSTDDHDLKNAVPCTVGKGINFRKCVQSLCPLIDQVSGGIQQAYDRLCVYQFINAVRQIFPGQMNPSGAYDSAAVSAASEKIHAAADAYYQLQSSACTVDESGNIVFSTEFSALNDPSFGDQSYGAYFTGLIQTLNLNGQTLFPENPIQQTEMEMTEPGMPGDDGGDGGDGGTTAQELQQAIEQQKKDIVECQLQIREADLAIKEYDANLQNETVTATMDGIVKQAGTTTEQPSSGGFIVITGKAGMYVQGTLSERSLDSLKVGDMISGTSWDTGSTFTAKITEISKYPSDSGSNVYYYDSTNDQNSSQYPFLAYIDEAEGLTAGSTVELSVTSQDTESGLMLPPYLIRTDSAGKSFCYVRGEDGKLARKYVKTKDTGYGITMILSGLSSDDYIAFPYGDDVKDGAPTKEVETLSAVSGSYYGVG